MVHQMSQYVFDRLIDSIPEKKVVAKIVSSEPAHISQTKPPYLASHLFVIRCVNWFIYKRNVENDGIFHRSLLIIVNRFWRQFDLFFREKHFTSFILFCLFISFTNGFFKQPIKIAWCMVESVVSKCLLWIYSKRNRIIIMWANRVAIVFHWCVLAKHPQPNSNVKYAILLKID